MIKLDYIRHFLIVAETGSIALAADRANISHTSIRNSIEKLESGLNTVLFVRKSSCGVELTSDGRKLVSKSKGLLDNVEEIEYAFLSEDKSLRGNLVVGCQEGLTWSLVPRAIDLMNERHPELKISMQTIWMDTKFETLDKGDVDVLISFTVDKVLPAKYQVVDLCSPKACVMMRKGHPLDNGKAVSLVDVAKFPHIFIKDGPAYPLFYGMYKKRGLEPNIHMFSNISTGTQSVIGRTDSVSLRILRPAHSFTPLGDEMVVPPIKDDIIRPRLIAVINKTNTPISLDKRVEFQKACQHLFDTNVMKKHIYY